MSNPKIRFSVVFFSIALAAAAVAGQQSKPTGQTGSQSGSQTGSHTGHVACWKQVGIAPAAMEQRRAIMQAARTKIEALCKDDSLTAQQKKEQIQQIHKEAAQQAEGLINPEQAEALKKCQQQQHEQAGSHQGHGAGPCGEPIENEESSPSSSSSSNPSN
jgi:hypothetical protein